jgi:threonylcarbamoyladenosine tRNA methylthiotransferase MtaB
MPRVSFHTLGCKLNFAETSTLARDFEKRGFESVPFGEASDIIVINTCTVTDQADAKCRNAIRRAARANKDAFIIVTGCYAQLGSEEIARIEGVDLVLGNAEKFDVFSFVESFEKQDHTEIHVSCINDLKAFGASYSTNQRTRAFLKIQDGCDYACSFCAIPMARGLSRSQDVDETIDQARAIAATGTSEIVLTGINVGLYGKDLGTTLAELVCRLDEEVDIPRIRISSIEPNLLTDEIIGYIASSRRFVPHFHVPLQSGDDDVLARMRRRYRREIYADRISAIKEQMPDAAIGCDVIAGFPAESPARFEHSVAFLQNLDVSYLHVFAYSERENTVAVRQLESMGGMPVPAGERKRRSRVLRLLSEKKRLGFYRSQLGKATRVLWEREEKAGQMFGWTDNYVRVQAPFASERSGKLEEVILRRLNSSGNAVCR